MTICPGISLVEDDKDPQPTDLRRPGRFGGYLLRRPKAFDCANEVHFSAIRNPITPWWLDIGLPQMDGISVLERWRRDERKICRSSMLTCARPLERQGDRHRLPGPTTTCKPFHIEECAGPRARADPPPPAMPSKRTDPAGPSGSTPRAPRIDLDGVPLKLTSHELRLLSYLMPPPTRRR